MKRRFLLSAVCMVLMLAAVYAGGSGEEDSAPVASEGFVYDGTGPITDIDGQVLTELAQNSLYTTVDMREAEIVRKVQEGANVTIDWTLVDPTSYADAVSPMLASGVDIPDIVLLPNLDQDQTYIMSGMFEPLDEHFDDMPNYSAWLEANPDIRASLTASDGHIYYMPTINVPYNYQPVVMYNMKWLSDAGLEVPATLDELTEVLRYFKSHDMNGNGEADEIPLSIMDDFLPYMFAPAFGLTFLDGQVEQGSGFMVNDEGEVVYAQATDEYRQYLEYLHGLYEEGLLEVEYTTLTRDQIIERFAQDRTGVTCDWSYQSSMTYSPQLPYYDGTEATGVVLQPPLSGPHEGYYIGRNPMGMVYGISSDSDKIKLAARYLDYAWGDANQEMYVWGIEGVSYVVNEDGSKSFTEKAQTDSNWLQALGINPAQVIPARQSVPATDVLVAKWHADMDKVIEPYVKAPWPFIYATEEESMITSMYMVDIQTYVDEMAVSFITGTTPLDEFDSYLEALDRMNLPQILEIKKAQYSRYQEALGE